MGFVVVRFSLAIALALAGAACVPARAGRDVSFGRVADGLLVDGVALPDRAPGLVRVRPGSAMRYGTAHLVGLIEDAATVVADAYPGGAPLRVGDLALPLGGRDRRHRSHRSGRDADILFYVADEHGKSLADAGWLKFNRFGIALDRQTAAVRVFDEACNWLFVRTLLADSERRIQWVFCSNGIKARLLRYATTHETDPQLIARAAYVLQQPTNAKPHDDHFHIRVMCDPQARFYGCIDTAPFWPWYGDEVEKDPRICSDALTDDELYRAITVTDSSSDSAE